MSWQQWFIAIWLIYGLVNGIIAAIRGTRGIRSDTIAAVGGMLGVIAALGVTIGLWAVLHSGGFW